MSSYNQKKSKKEKCCSRCNRNIVNERHVRCLKCPLFYQCLQCLSTSQEYENHNLDHSFLIIEPRPYPIFCQNWDIQDEILLLEGIKFLGVGNWNDISDYMKTKTASDIETHYTAIYINSPTAPLPVPDPHRIVQKPPSPPYETKPVDSCPSEAHEKHMSAKNKKERNVPAEYNGYMPWRHEFEIEYNNDAEFLVAKLEFKDGEETQQSFKSKLDSLKAYNFILSERKFRTKVIEDSNIHHKSTKSVSKNDKDLDARYLGGFSPEERAADSTIVSLSPYLSFDKTQYWANIIHQKIQFQNKIKQRKQWLKCGIRSLQEGTLFSNLQGCINKGKNPVITDIENWDELIAKYNRTKENPLAKNKESFLIQETQLCSKENINPKLYLFLKCLLIRENAIRPLRKQEAIEMDPKNTQAIAKIYDLLASLGMIRTV